MLWAVLRVASMFRQSRTHAFIRSTITRAAIVTEVRKRAFLLVCEKGSLQKYQLQKLVLLSPIQSVAFVHVRIENKIEIGAGIFSNRLENKRH